MGGSAEGALLHADTGLSFWGGVEPFTGEVIDRHHPLSGSFLPGRVLAIPSGRGSCTGSSVMLEILLNGHAPAALLLAEPDEILTLGVLVAQALFGRSIPVLCLGHEAFEQLSTGGWARIEDGQVTLTAERPADGWQGVMASDAGPLPEGLVLTAGDHELLDGQHGKAAQAAMQIVLRMAALQGAKDLLDIAQAHIDGCIYTGPASLRFARQLADWGGKVKVPTTLNSISVDHRRWRELGVDKAFGEPAAALGDAYMEMGAQMSYTCAPYLLDSKPSLGEQVVWAESNAVVYANSVLGARTLKYPDYLDICIALTGRAPNVGSHRDEGRLAVLRIDVELPADHDESIFPLLGYHIGELCGTRIPVVDGLQPLAPDSDALKAFGAAFATTSAAPMFHIAGVTPEAPDVATALGGKAPLQHLRVTPADLIASWRELDHAAEPSVQLVSLGNPHFSASECAELARLVAGRRKHPGVALVVALGRAVEEKARAAGDVKVLEDFGVQLLNDTCWCMIGEPVIPPSCTTLITNSAKYAHYGPGLAGRQVHFGSLAACVEAACSGRGDGGVPRWLSEGVR
ncbi:aconitase family protein [Pseudomonas nitroreducens]|uniref:Aconitase family protein n=1 Tax=Pseudomonas nitroreducens TaxID=46680 RepID=A0ABS0KJT9_PSENT|nr:aconitase family protein [Pseudomonas nitroreducens]MBG6288325.1 aconitase family protein [Pseudomonas nitroreducens]